MILQNYYIIMLTSHVLDLEMCQNQGDFGTFSGRVRDLMKLRYFPALSTSKQCNFDVKEALRKKCTTYSCVKSSQESIGGVYNVWK